NDVLISALSDAFGQWMGRGSMLLDVEGHGREDVGVPLDLTRSVGWFTSLFPVRLELARTGDAGVRLKAMKERLRAVPRRGVGYGVLAWLTEDTELAQRPHADVVFNYLGQFDQLVAHSSLFRFAPEHEGP